MVHRATKTARNTAFIVLTSAMAFAAWSQAPPEPPPGPVFSFGHRAGSDRLIGTNGLSNIEGAGGGGLATWATITGYGTNDQTGANIHGTYIHVPDFNLNSDGVAVGLYRRFEVSYTHNFLYTGATGTKLGIGNGYVFNTDIVGVKARLFGDVVYDQSKFIPVVSVGAQYKHSNDGKVLSVIGARGTEDVDFFGAATKLFLRESLLVDTTLRLTKANQFGILGFGSAGSNGYHPEFEGSAAYLVNPNIAVGAEYRTKPHDLGFTKEDNVYDVFGTYFFNNHLSAAIAYLDLGTIATFKTERGEYVSVQLGF